MKAISQAVGWRIVLAIGVLVLGLSRPAEAQVGLTSGLAQVTLLARRSSQGTLAVGTIRDVSRDGTARMTTARVRISANSGYRLAVRRSRATHRRVWVKSIDGNFQELTADAPVTVDRGAHTGGERERELQFRVEGARPDRATPLPVFYDLVVSPTP